MSVKEPIPTSVINVKFVAQNEILHLGHPLKFSRNNQHSKNSGLNLPKITTNFIRMSNNLDLNNGVFSMCIRL